MSAPVILYENAFRNATPTATDTASGYNAAYIADYRAYTKWKANSAGVKYLTVDGGSSQSVTLANTKLSLRTGYAFADFSGVDLSGHIGKRIKVTDSAGKSITGYIKAAGSGVTYGSELLINREFTSDAADWTAVDSSLASVAGGESGNCLQITRTGGDFQMAKQSQTAGSAGGLFRMTAYLKSGTSGNESALIGIYYNSDSSWFSTTTTSSGTWTLVTCYGTLPVAQTISGVFLYKNSATAGTMLFDTASLVPVNTPSSTGATIVSTRGGETYAWASEESGFNRNDSSGYTVVIEPTADTLALASHTLWTCGVAVSVESSDNNSDWTERLAASIPAADTPCLKTFTQAAARYWRVKLASGSAAPEIGEVYLGPRLTFPKSPDIPHTPYTYEVEAENAIGKAGHILGSVLRFVGIKISAKFSQLTRAWIYGDYLTFWADHGRHLRPFFWAWDITNFPTEVFFVTLNPPAPFGCPLRSTTYANQLSVDMVGVRDA